MTDTSRKADHAPGYVPNTDYSQEDWDEVSDNPVLTEAELAELRPAREVPEVFALLPKRGRGRPKLPDAKVNITLRIDPGIVEAFRATGPGWQTRINEILGDAVRAGLPKPDAA